MLRLPCWLQNNLWPTPSSLIMRPGAAVCPGRGEATQKRCCFCTRLCPGRPLQTSSVPPLHWLLLVCAGRHRTPHTWDLHQVGRPSSKQTKVISLVGTHSPVLIPSWFFKGLLKKKQVQLNTFSVPVLIINNKQTSLSQLSYEKQVGGQSSWQNGALVPSYWEPSLDIRLTSPQAECQSAH